LEEQNEKRGLGFNIGFRFGNEVEERGRCEGDINGVGE